MTSLDVIHSFWAYQLGVKADANPGTNNVAYVKPSTPARSPCAARAVGLWHGAMYNFGHVVPDAQFTSWAPGPKTQLAAVTKQLPPYALVYDPTVIPQLNKGFTSGGIYGAGGAYYGPRSGKVQP